MNIKSGFVDVLMLVYSISSGDVCLCELFQPSFRGETNTLAVLDLVPNYDSQQLCILGPWIYIDVYCLYS